jgi:hypothetical protein
MKRIVIIAILVMFAVSAWTIPGDGATRGEDTGYFAGNQIFSSSRSLSGGIGVGDVDHDGRNEIAVSDFEGNIVLIQETDPGIFESELIYSEPRKNGETQGILDLMVGDFLTDRPGAEIIAGGYSKKLVAVYKEGDTYASKVLYTSPFQIFNIETGEFDGSYEGEEIILASFDDPDKALRVLHRDGSDFIVEAIPLPDTPKGLEVADIDPNAGGNEIWVTTSGKKTQVGTESGLYEIRSDRIVFERYMNPSKLIANIKAGDVWSGNPGQELLTVDFGGICKLFWEEGGLYKSRDILEAKNPVGEPALLEGLHIADFNPVHPGEEGLVTGYYNDVTQVLEVGGQMTSELVWQASMSDANLEISGVTVGEFSKVYPGVETAVAHRSGWVAMIRYEEDGLALWADKANIGIEDGVRGEFQVELIPEGYARGPVQFSKEGGEGLTFTFPEVVIDGHDPVFASIKVISDFGDATTRIVPFTIKASIGEIDSAPVEMQATVTMSGDISLTPSTVTLYPEIVSDSIVSMTLFGPEKVNLTVVAPSGIQVNAPSVLMRNKTASMTISTEKEQGNYIVTLRGMVGSRLAVESTLHIKIRSLEKDIEVSLDEIAENRYRVTWDYNGARLDYPLQIDVFIGDELKNTTSLVILGPEEVAFEFAYRGNEDRDVLVVVSASGKVGYENVPGQVARTADGSDFPTALLVVFLVVIALAGVMVFLLLTWARHRPDDYAGLERIGGPSRYRVTQPEGGRTRPVSGPRMAPGPPPRRGIPPRERVQRSNRIAPERSPRHDRTGRDRPPSR